MLEFACILVLLLHYLDVCLYVFQGQKCVLNVEYMEGWETM